MVKSNIIMCLRGGKGEGGEIFIITFLERGGEGCGMCSQRHVGNIYHYHLWEFLGREEAVRGVWVFVVAVVEEEVVPLQHPPHFATPPTYIHAPHLPPSTKKKVTMVTLS